MQQQNDVRGEQYYFMRYTSHDGKIVIHMTDREDTWLRDQERHRLDKNFEFFTADRFGMTLNCS